MNSIFRNSCFTNKPLLALVSWLLAIIPATAQDANVIPFQGQLANQAGQPLSPTNAVTLVFRLYTAPVGGKALWEESQPNISVNMGRFSILLGSRTMLPSAPIFNSTLYLGITVDDGNPQTADVEMRPRQALVPVISARYAQNSDKLQGYDWSVLFGTNSPLDGKIQGAQIAARSITAAQIASKTITGDQLATNTVTSVQIATNTITPENLIATYRAFINSMSPPGTVAGFAGTNAPDGWLICDGQEVNRLAYSTLFSTIGVIYGVGDGTSTFNLPNLKGRVLVGMNPPEIEFNSLGMTGGTKTLDTTHSHSVPFSGWPWDNGSSPTSSGTLATLSRSSFDQHAIGNQTTGVGGNATQSTLPPYIVINYIIKY